MGPPLHCYACAGGGAFLEPLCRAGSERCCKVMVEAPNPRRLHPTYISYVDKVFSHLDRQWMGIWVHPYTVMLVQVGVDFKKIYV
jgi:hypothetical protein